jgi:23S rRNA pseudouridine2605 synthase
MLRHEGDKTWFEISLREGRNQQIRRMGEATGFPVMRLARISFAGISHEGIRPGEWRFLTVDELLTLRKQFGVPKRVRSAPSSERATRPSSASAARARHGSGGRKGGGASGGSSGEPKRERARTGRAGDERQGAAGKPAARSARNDRAGDERQGAAGKPAARSARNDRSGTKPRGAEPRASRARGREGR